MLRNGARKDCLIKRIQIQNPHLAPKPCHILDDAVGLRLTDMKLIFRFAVALQKLHKGLHCEGIMLRGYAERIFPVRSAHIFLADHVLLLQELSCVAQEFIPLRGRCNSSSGTQENGDPKLLLQLVQGRCKTWL